MTELRISHDLALPVEAVTQAIAILARKGAGKTYTASVLVEEVVRAQVPVVVLDPTGAWWGLRSSVDGDRPGLPVVIFGGDHGDVPLEPAAGSLIADVVVDHPGAYVVDLSAFTSKAAEIRFAAEFLERLYRAKKRDTGPLLLVVDEADVFAPQRPGPDQTRTLGALESIVRRGRIKGLGDVLITQRAAVLSKNVLTQTEVLVVMQTTGPQDRAAIDEWIAGNGTREQRDTVLGSLASLEQGEAWVWSPAFLRILQRVRIRRRTTFDSSRTPKVGETTIAPRAFADVDLEHLGQRIAATREQQKANDPAELRRRIRELEIQVELQAQALAAPREPEVRIERVEVPVLAESDVAALRVWARDVHVYADALSAAADSITAAIGRVTTQGEPVETGAGASIRAAALPGAATRGAGSLRTNREPGAAGSAAAQLPDGPLFDPNGGAGAPRGVRSQVREDQAPAGQPAPGKPAATPPVAAPAAASPSERPASLGKAERSILAALAQFPGGLSKVRLSLLSGYSHTSSSFANALGALRSAGLIDRGTPIRVTEAGRLFPGLPAPLSRDEALEALRSRLGKAERTFLDAIMAAHPDVLSRDQLSERTGYSATSSSFANALGRLRSLELISGLALNPELAA